MSQVQVVKRKKPLRVAVVSTPWIKVPPDGYGGIEAVVDGLVKGLLNNGVEVEVFGVGGRTLHGAKVHSLYKKEQYKHIYRPVFESVSIPLAHIDFAMKRILDDGNFDVIHDHNGQIGPMYYKWATQVSGVPPVVHTLHGPQFSPTMQDEKNWASNRPMWREIGSPKRSFLVGISDSMVANVPSEIKPSILQTVYNAVDVQDFPFVEKKKNYFVTLGRFTSTKGQHIAAKYAAKFRYRLRMAGSVVDISTPSKLILELANPMSKYRRDPDFRYYSDKVFPYTIKNPKITFTGNIAGEKKMRFLSEAKALLFPIQWEEPFGMVVIEALACGTPVVAMKRGAVPEIIEHGVNGFLAETEAEFAAYMKRVKEIDPAACRKSVERKFSIDTMAKAYIERYEEAIRRANS